MTVGYVITVIMAVLLDLYFGEPKNGHPLIIFGHFATFVENICFKIKLSAFLQKITGILALAIIAIIFMIPLYYLQQQLWFNWIIAPIILYFCIAATSLKQHANDVFKALEQNNLNLARKKVAMIVSRNCTQMDVLAVRRATLESTLENGADAVFAPLFWFIIGGCMGVVLYRLCNTLDAMWGYKNQRYLHFGWAVARLDDGLNFIPARLTACSYILLGNSTLGWHCWHTQAQLLDSPNAGVVMTAGAGSLNLQLGGDAFYHGQRKKKPFFGGHNLPVNNDICRANELINWTLILWVGLLIISLISTLNL